MTMFRCRGRPIHRAHSGVASMTAEDEPTRVRAYWREPRVMMALFRLDAQQISNALANPP